MQTKNVLSIAAFAFAAITLGSCGNQAEQAQKELDSLRNVVAEQQNQLQAPIYEKANKAVQELAKAKGLTALFDATQALYFDESKVIDLTPEARKVLGIAEGRTLETLQAELQEKAQAAQQQAQ